MAPSSSFGQSLFPLALSLLLTAVAAAAAGEEAREDRTAANATAAEGVGGMGALVMAALGSPMALVQHFAPAWLAGNPMLPMLAYSAMAFGTTMVTLGLRRLWRYLDRAFYTHVTLHGHTRSYEWCVALCVLCGWVICCNPVCVSVCVSLSLSVCVCVSVK